MIGVRYGVLILLLASVASAQAPRTSHPPHVAFVPTSRPAVLAMLKLAGVGKMDVVYDLGCGDGRIVIAAAKELGARAVGIELDPVLLDRARRDAKAAGVESRVRFEQKDLFQADLRGATVVMLYLLESINVKLRPKLLKELRPGARVVSNTFAMGDWKPDRQITVAGSKGGDPFTNPTLFLWKIPQQGVAH